MNTNKCLYCGEIIPEGRQICWRCEHEVTGDNVLSGYNRSPSEKQIMLAGAIANTLNIDFPLCSDHFTAAAYWEFIHDHIDEAKSYWDCDLGDGLDDEMMWFSPLNQ